MDSPSTASKGKRGRTPQGGGEQGMEGSPQRTRLRLHAPPQPTSPTKLTSRIQVDKQAVYDQPLVQHPLLVSANVWYHSALQVFICADHSGGIRADELVNHLVSKHNLPFSTKDKEAVFMDCPPHAGFHPSLPVFDNGMPMVQLPFLQVVQDGYGCSFRECHYYAAKETTMRNHLSSSHQGLTGSPPLYPLLLQRIYSQGERPWFVVAPRDRAMTEVTVYTSFLQNLPLPPPRGGTDAGTVGERELTPFLRRTGWRRHVDGLDTAYLHSLASGSAAKEPHLLTLKGLVVEYLKAVQTTIAESKNLLLLQLINSESATQLNHDPFKPLQEAKTIQAYASYFTRLFWFILRAKDQPYPPVYPIWLSTYQTQLCSRLVDVLQREPSPEVFAKVFHPLAHSLLCVSPPGATMDPWRYPLQQFLALSHMKSDGQFATPSHITPNLAAIQWCFKAVIFNHIHHYVIPNTQQDPQAMEHAIKSACEVLYPGHFSSYSNLLDLKHLTNAIAFQTKSMPTIYWMDGDMTELSVMGAKLTMDGIRDVVKGVEREAMALMQDRLLLGMAMDSLPTSNKDGQLFDDLPDEEAGQSFITNRGNPFVANQWLLMKHLCDTPEVADPFHRGIYDTRVIWIRQRLEGFIEDCSRFMDLLAPLIHLTYGGPARKTELLATKYTNTIHSARNVYILFQRVCLVGRYHKGSNQTGSDKVIPRFLPASLSRLLIIFLAYVRPVEVYFLRQLDRHKDAHLTSTHLFVANGQQWEPAHFTNTFTLQFEKHAKVKINPQIWRQATKAIADARSINLDGTLGNESAVHLQAGHSSITAETRYAVNADALQDLNLRDLLVFKEASRDWQRYIGCGVDGEGEGTVSTATGQKTQEDMIRRIIREELEGFQQRVKEICTAAPAGTTCRSPGDEAPPTTQSLASPSAVGVPVRRVVRLLSGELDNTPLPEMKELLKVIFPGSGTAFRSVFQGMACLATIVSPENLLVVGPTSAGKSLIWLLPAVYPMEEGTVTVVVVPLSALLREFKSKADRLKIRASKWQKDLSSAFRLVFVSAERAGTEEFVEWCTSLGARLKRVVFEEAHLVLTAGYRPCLALLSRLRVLEVPFVVITATCPPSMMDLLLDKLAIHRARLCFAATHRSEASYAIKPMVKPSELVERTLEVLEEVKAKISHQGQVIIFVNSKAAVDGLVDRIPGSVGHHSEMGEEDREASVKNLLEGLSRVIVATSGLACGVNFPGVEGVIHSGTPHSLVDFAQESGRGGRQGQRYISVVIPDRLRKGSVTDKTGMGWLLNWLLAEECRREILGKYLDGKAVKCSDIPHANLCDWCQAEISSPTPSPLTDSTSPASSQCPSIMASGTLQQTPTNSICSLGTTQLNTPHPTQQFGQSGRSTLASGVKETPLLTDFPETDAFWRDWAGTLDKPERGGSSQQSACTQMSTPTPCPPSNRLSGRSSVVLEAKMAANARSELAVVTRELTGLLRRGFGGCHWCMAHGKLDKGHSTFSCPFGKQSAPRWIDNKKVWKKTLRFSQMGTLCFKCFLPLSPPFHVGEERCQFPDVCVEPAYVLFSAGLMAPFKAKFRVDIQSLEDWTRYLTEPPAELNVPNIWRVAHWMLERSMGK